MTRFYLFLLIIPLFLAACANGPKDFEAYLADYYKDLPVQTEDGDNHAWVDSAHFLNKSQRAGQGYRVLPEDPSAYPPNLGDTNELKGEYDRLFSMLQSDRVVFFPKDTALTQVAYDCWLEETFEECDNRFKVACQNLYSDTMADLIARPAPAPDLRLHYGTGQYQLDNRSENKLVNFVDGLKADALKIYGYADGQGASQDNMRLSKRRARTVAELIAAKGVSINEIGIIGFGDLPAQKIGAGDAPDKQFRRVDIHVIE